MSLLQALILGTVQGLTEFIPVSSSGHLVLVEFLLGLEVESLKAFDVMVHMGTLVAIFGYFWKDFWEFILAVWHLVKRTPVAEVVPEVRQHQRWLGYIILGSVPAAGVGLFFEDWIDAHFRNPLVVAGVMGIVGMLFFVAEWMLTKVNHKKSKNDDSEMKWRNFTLIKALSVGVAQAFALIPGVSRSGSTIATAISFGIPREKAARFSFLLGAPAIFGAGLVTVLKMPETGWAEVGFNAMVVGFLSSAVVGYMCVAFLMKFLKKYGLRVFGIYLILVAVVVWGYWGYFVSDLAESLQDF